MRHRRFFSLPSEGKGGERKKKKRRLRVAIRIIPYSLLQEQRAGGKQPFYLPYLSLFFCGERETIALFPLEKK